MQKRLRFTGKNPALFFPTLKKRVDSYFSERRLSKKANGEMIFKSFFYAGGVILLYSLIMFGGFSPWTMLILAIILGMFKAFVGFNISHDAMHGAYSHNHRFNNVLGRLAFNLLGGNDSVWKTTHNLVHHTYTNIPDHDEDIDVAPGMIRLSPTEKLRPMMRYQHFYAFPLYGLAYISWIFRKDYVKFFQKTIGQTQNKYTKTETFNLFFFKAIYYLVFIVVPLIFLPISWWQFLIGFFAMGVAGGLVLGLVFQLAHVVEGTSFPQPNPDNEIPELWAVHQLQTTANFARKSKLACFICGGLNMQVEHHLFPQICHVHYPKISVIVKETAEEFGLPYLEHPTFWKATVSHYKTLRKFGKEALELIGKNHPKKAVQLV